MKESPRERAESLFSALDKDNDGCLTKAEFVSGYTKRSHILRRQDSDDQRRKLNCLILFGSVLNNRQEEKDTCANFLANLLTSRTGLQAEWSNPAQRFILRMSALLCLKAPKYLYGL